MKIQCSKEDCYDWFRRTADYSQITTSEDQYHEYRPTIPAVHLSNPKTKEFNIVRTSLIPGILKTMNHNKHNSLPIQLFEVSDVVVQCKTTETGTRNQRRAAALVVDKVSIFEAIHGLIDHLLTKLNCKSKIILTDSEKKNGLKKTNGVEMKVYELVY